MSGAACASGASAGIVAYPDLVTEAIDSADYTMHSDGSITHDQDETGDLLWVENTAPTNYEVSFASGSWLDFSTDRTITETSEIRLRDKYTTTVVKTVTVTLF